MQHNQKKSPEGFALVIAALRATGNVSAAARVVGAARSTIHRWYLADKAGDEELHVLLPEGERVRLHEAWDDALRVAVDSLALLDRERAVRHMRPRYDKDGQPVWLRDPLTGRLKLDDDLEPIHVMEPVFEERSMDRQLKAGDPETYRERVDVKHGGEVKTGGVIVVSADMPPDEWAAMVKRMKEQGHDL